MSKKENRFMGTDEELVDNIFMYIQNMMESIDDLEKVYVQLFEPTLEELLSRYENEEDIPGYSSLKLMVEVFGTRAKNVLRENKMNRRR